MFSELPSEIILHIAAECDDFKTITNLALTCKDVYELLAVSHEKSLSKAWVQRYNLYTGRVLMLGPHGWSGTVLDTIGTASRTTVSDENLLPPFSLKAVRELDARNQRIDALFGYRINHGDWGGEGPPLLRDVIRQIWTPGDVADPDPGRFVDGLRRACVFVDTMLDCMAGVYVYDDDDDDDEDQPRGHKRLEGGDDEEEELGKEEDDEEAGTLVRTTTMDDGPTPQERKRRAHWATRRYILSIADSGLAGVEDLIHLYILVYIIIPAALWRSGWLLWHDPTPSQLAADVEDTRAPRLLAMQEVFLRYGSVVLQGWFLMGDGGGEFSAWLEHVSCHVADEIKAYESGRASQAEDEEDDDGTGVLPGLSSALYNAVGQRFEYATTSAGVDTDSDSFSSDDGDDESRLERQVRDQHLRDVVKIVSVARI